MLPLRAVLALLLCIPLGLWGQNLKSLKGPDGVTYTYNITGQEKAAHPRNAIPAGMENCNASSGWISYSFVHQLDVDPILLAECRKVVEAKKGRRNMSLCQIAYEITFGAGYYLFCPGKPKPFKDLKFQGESEIYLIHVDTENGEIFIAEKRGEEVLEVNRAEIGKRWFEPDPEPYERPYITGQPICEESYFLDPLGIIMAEPTSGFAPLEVQFDGSASYDRDQRKNFIKGYAWDFGDGASSTETAPKHMYQNEGTYQVTLTVTDNEDVTHDTTQTILVKARPLDSLLPVSVFTAKPSNGQAPLLVAFDGTESYDQDEEGDSIVVYTWDFGDGQGGTGMQIQHNYVETGTYEVSLTVTDDEGDQASSSRYITVTPPAPAVTTAPCPVDTCYQMIYTIRVCGDRIDTVGRAPMRVTCPAPAQPVIVWAGGCEETTTVVAPQEETSPLELAGGPNFRFFRGQLQEFGMGFNGQIRLRLDKARKIAVLGDFGVTPVRRALPLDDRPYKWSNLRDSIDTETGLPLVWQRGTLRGTANAAIGLEFAPLPWFFAQMTTGFEWTFNQIEVSDELKNPLNEFKGFKTRLQYYEPRIGIRRSHLEVYYSIQFLPENRPFTFIPANQDGGTHNRLTDKAHTAGMLLWF